jgi:small subunit ribosomal protein S8
MSTDNIADMLTKVRNAYLAKHRVVRVPSTKMTRSIARILFSEKFINSFEDFTIKGCSRSLLCLSLKYTFHRDQTGKTILPVIEKIQRVSKPGLRVYVRANKIPRILGGLGIAIVSTSSGLLTDQQAREKKAGGELLCYIC